MQRTTAEITEIERHKYYLSEQQGHDVGWEFAEQDWAANYGNAWPQEHLPTQSTPDTLGYNLCVSVVARLANSGVRN